MNGWYLGWLVLALGLHWGAVPAALADEDQVQDPLAVELHQALREAPAALRWLMPNEHKPVSHTEVGIGPDSCAFPQWAPPSPSGQPRLLVRCGTLLLGGHGMTRVSTLTSWVRTEQGWGPGQLVSVRYSTRAFGSNLGSPPPIVWHNGWEADLFARAFSLMSVQQIRELQMLLNSYEPTNHALVALDQWRTLSWPDGVLGLRADGSLLLQRGGLAGVGDLVERLAEQPAALPVGVTGLIRPAAAKSPPGRPMFMLQMIETEDLLYAVALTDGPLDRVGGTVQLLRGEPHFNLVLVSVERAL